MGEDVYPYEYMDGWKKFNETLLLDKGNFYSYYGTYFWCRLHARKTSSWIFWKKKQQQQKQQTKTQATNEQT